MPKKDQKTFIEDLINTFPEIKEDVSDEDWLELISLQISCFRRFTQKAIDTNDVPTMKKCFQFVEDHIDIVEFAIENSLTITWLGKLNFAKNKNAYHLLAQKLRDLYEQLEKKYAQASKNEKLNAFLKGLN